LGMNNKPVGGCAVQRHSLIPAVWTATITEDSEIQKTVLMYLEKWWSHVLLWYFYASVLCKFITTLSSSDNCTYCHVHIWGHIQKPRMCCQDREWQVV
jgi:hypothetical protein